MEKSNDIKYGQLWARYSELVESDAVGVYRITFEGLKNAIDEAMTTVAEQAPTGARWVKASERLPEKDGLYCFRVSGGYMGAYVTTGPKGNRWVRDASWFTIANWKDCEWLDESGTAKVNPDELWDEFSEYIDTDIDSCQAFAGSTVMTKEGWRKVVERLKM